MLVVHLTSRDKIRSMLVSLNMFGVLNINKKVQFPVNGKNDEPLEN